MIEMVVSADINAGNARLGVEVDLPTCRVKTRGIQDWEFIQDTMSCLRTKHPNRDKVRDDPTSGSG